MAMIVKNNMAAMMALGELNKNNNKLAKQLKKISTGERVTGAEDDASGYAISERMRIRLRALNQDEVNVTNGSALLNAAEGGVQNQVDLLKSVFERVVNAANDTNTDKDRATIQKEITQCYREMEDIACETNYNGKLLLLGDDYWKTVYSWDVKDKAELLPDSDAMGVIPDIYPTLDGVDGPFDLFSDYTVQGVDIDSLSLTGTPQYFSGGTDGDPNIIDLDLSVYSSVDDLDNVGFMIAGKKYVLTKDTSRLYRDKNVTKIDISGCGSTADVANAIVAAVQANNSNHVTPTVSGSKVTFQTTSYYNGSAELSNSVTVEGISGNGGTDTITYPGSPGSTAKPAIHATVSGTGIFGDNPHLSGGEDGININAPLIDVDRNKGRKPGKVASLQKEISAAPNGSGVTIHGLYGNEGYLKFVNGSSGFSYDRDTGIYTVGKNAKEAVASIGGLRVTVSNGVMTVTAPDVGAVYNSCYVSDGYTVDEPAKPAIPATSPHTVSTTYTAITALDTSGVTNHQTGTDGNWATYTIDLTSTFPVDLTSSELNDCNKFIRELYGKTIVCSSGYYDLVDSEILGGGTGKGMGGKMVDLAALRKAVAGGKTIAEAVADLFSEKFDKAAIETDGSGNITGVTLTAVQKGTRGNSESIQSVDGSLRNYDVDFGTWFKNNPDAGIPKDLYGKGFRAYCATCADQWFNFIFLPKAEDDADERIDSGTDTEEIKTLVIDVSEVTDAASLVKAIYEQAAPILSGEEENPYIKMKSKYDHFMRLEADPNNGILTLYDNRDYPFYPEDYLELREMGAKIADGVVDNVIPSLRNLYCKNLVIQHTDHANQNIRLRIPRTTLDHVLGYNPEYLSADDFNVMTKNGRDRLLGTTKRKGILERGINYLTNANILIGAQNARLSMTKDNIVTNLENTCASESIIRDANVAKEMMEYTKASMLAQASQSMLAQANTNSSQVLSLLQ